MPSCRLRVGDPSQPLEVTLKFLHQGASLTTPPLILSFLLILTTLVCVCPSKIHKLEPNPQGSGNRRWDNWEVLSHEGGVLMTGVSALIKETPQSFLTPSSMWGHGEKSAHGYLENCPHLTMLTPDYGLPASRTVRNSFLLLISHQMCGLLL